MKLQRKRLATSEQALEMDKQTQKKLGVPAMELMNRAGCEVYEFLESEILPCLPIEPILILVGPGNNGGDAVVVARELVKRGRTEVHVWTVGEPQSESLKEQIESVPAFEIGLEEFTGSDSQRRFMDRCCLIVDGIFGVGLNRSLDGLPKKAIEFANESLIPILSVDISSGLNANTGRKMGEAILAEWTVTFEIEKPGHFIWDGPKCTGRLVTKSIGFDLDVMNEIANTHFIFTKKLARELIPNRSDTANKSTSGRVSLYAGRDGMWGAAVLAAKGAYRSGAGYVTLRSFDNPSVAVSELPDMLTSKMDEIPKEFDHVNIVGPGFGVNKNTENLIESMIEKQTSHVLLDADAITTLGSMEVDSLPESWVLTPHSGEMARLLNCPVEDVDQDRFAACKEFVERYKCHVLLKGYKTIVAGPGFYDIINSGNSALATAGTGDILSGMIGAFMAGGLGIRDAAGLGAYLHGATADLWIKEGNAKNSLMASDILNLLPRAFQSLVISDED